VRSAIALIGLVRQPPFELLRIVGELGRELVSASLELVAEVSPRIAIQEHDARQGDDSRQDCHATAIHRQAALRISGDLPQMVIQSWKRRPSDCEKLDEPVTLKVDTKRPIAKAVHCDAIGDGNLTPNGCCSGSVSAHHPLMYFRAHCPFFGVELVRQFPPVVRLIIEQHSDLLA